MISVVEATVAADMNITLRIALIIMVVTIQGQVMVRIYLPKAGDDTKESNLHIILLLSLYLSIRYLFFL
jgi:hypothetical protein